MFWGKLSRCGIRRSTPCRHEPLRESTMPRVPGHQSGLFEVGGERPACIYAAGAAHCSCMGASRLPHLRGSALWHACQHVQVPAAAARQGGSTLAWRMYSSPCYSQIVHMLHACMRVHGIPGARHAGRTARLRMPRLRATSHMVTIRGPTRSMHGGVSVEAPCQIRTDQMGCQLHACSCSCLRTRVRVYLFWNDCACR